MWAVQINFLQNGCHLSGFQMVELPNFRSHSKFGLFKPTSFQPFKIGRVKKTDNKAVTQEQF